MNKLVFPALLVATIMVAGAFAFMPVEQATTVHTSGTATSNVMVGSAETVTTDAATIISLNVAATNWVTTGAAATATLADGSPGQIKLLCLVTDGGDQVVTPANLGAGEGGAGNTLTFPDANDCVSMVFYPGYGWAVIINTGGVVIA